MGACSSHQNPKHHYQTETDGTSVVGSKKFNRKHDNDNCSVDVDICSPRSLGDTLAPGDVSQTHAALPKKEMPMRTNAHTPKSFALASFPPHREAHVEETATETHTAPTFSTSLMQTVNPAAMTNPVVSTNGTPLNKKASTVNTTPVLPPLPVSIVPASDATDWGDIPLIPMNGGESVLNEDTQSAKYALMRPRPTLTICSTLDEDEDGDGMQCCRQQTESGTFALTPVVALAPFARRGWRILTASMFQEYYGNMQDDSIDTDSLVEGNDAIHTPNTEGNASNEPVNERLLGGIDDTPLSSVKEQAVKCKGVKKRLFFSFRGSSGDLKEREKEKDREKEKEGKPKCGIPPPKEVAPVEQQSSSRPTREQIIRVGSQRLQKRVDKLHLLQHSVKDDGNCQFRAIAQQMLGSEEYHELVRVHVVTYMMSVRDRFDCYFDGKEAADAYYKELLKNGTWGDELTLRGASDSLFINIHVLSSERRNFYITYRPSHDAPPPPTFLVDVASLRERNQSRVSSNPSPLLPPIPLSPALGQESVWSKSLELSEHGYLLRGGGRVTPPAFSPTGTPRRERLEVSFRAAKRCPPTTTRTKSAETKAMETDGGNARRAEAVNANALQRRLQRKLTDSMERRRSAADVHCSAVPNASLSFPSVAADTPMAAHARGRRGAARGVRRQSHLRTVSQDLAKFWAVGAEMERRGGNASIRFASPLFVRASPCKAPQLQQPQHQHQYQPQQQYPQPQQQYPQPQQLLQPLLHPLEGEAGGGGSSPLALSLHALSSGGVYFLGSSAKAVGTEAPLSPLHGRQPSFSWDSHSHTSPSSSWLPPAEDMNDTRLLLESRSEPIDVFLSYLFPVHYNALSLAEEEGTRPSESPDNPMGSPMGTPSISVWRQREERHTKRTPRNEWTTHTLPHTSE